MAYYVFAHLSNGKAWSVKLIYHRVDRDLSPLSVASMAEVTAPLGVCPLTYALRDDEPLREGSDEATGGRVTPSVAVPRPADVRHPTA